MGPPNPHGFYKRVFDSLELFNAFLKRVVVSRGRLGFVTGLGGSGRISLLGCMFGFGLILLLLLPSW